jgi:hypothetical protein
MTILRQIKDLRQEYATVHSHILRRLVHINGGIPLCSDPKKPLRRTLLPGFLVYGGLPSAPAYEPDSADRTPDHMSSNTKQDQEPSILDCVDEDVIA